MKLKNDTTGNYMLSGIFFALVIMRRNAKESLRIGRMGYVLWGAYGLYLSMFPIVYVCPLALVIYPKWMLLDQWKIPMYFGATLFGIELLLLIQNIRISGKNNKGEEDGNCDQAVSKGRF